jgi:hypothetical protein
MFLIFPNRLTVWIPIQRLTHLFSGIFWGIFPIEYPFECILIGLLNELLPFFGPCWRFRYNYANLGRFIYGIFWVWNREMMFLVRILNKF